MKNYIALLVSCFMPLCCLAQLPTATNSLSDAFLDVIEQRLKTSGPDFEMGEFLSGLATKSAWERREVIFALTRGYLDDTNATKVDGAINVLRRLRNTRLHSGPPPIVPVPEEVIFVSKLDSVVLAHFSYFKSLHNDDVYKRLSLYLGGTDSEEANRQLKEIANSAIDNEQALICLASPHYPANMDFLLPFMLASSPGDHILPYCFGKSYGQAAIPYLRRAISEAKSATTRLEAACQLVQLRVPAGFQYLQDIALQNPKPEGRSGTQLERIRDFAMDYLSLPDDAVKPEVIAAFIAEKQTELCEVKSQKTREHARKEPKPLGQ